jgi:hypothetical protein
MSGGAMTHGRAALGLPPGTGGDDHGAHAR